MEPHNNDLLIASQHHLFTINTLAEERYKLKFEADGYGKYIAAAPGWQAHSGSTGTPMK